MLGSLATVAVTAVAVVGFVATSVAPPHQSTEQAASLVQSAAEVAAAPLACRAASVEERAALTLVVGLPGVTEPDDPLVDRLVDVGVGGVMLRDENVQTTEQTRDLVAGLRDRLGQHLLVAVDQEGGRVTSLGALTGSTPSARRLGRSGPDAAAEGGAELGELLADLGIDWVLAPVVDLDDGPYDGLIGDRSFGGDADEVAEAAGAFADALHDAGIAVTLKHFPGLGGDADPHDGPSIDLSSEATLTGSALAPFEALIDDGADAVMVGHVTYPFAWGMRPASLEPGAYALLRSRGFDGVAITDALGMGAVHSQWGFDSAPALAIEAGADAALVNQGDHVEELVDGLVAAVTAGELPEARLDEAVGRILELRDQDPDGVICSPS